MVSGPRRHQEAAGIHGEAAQDSAVGLFNFDIRIVVNTHYQIFKEGVVLRLFSAYSVLHFRYKSIEDLS